MSEFSAVFRFNKWMDALPEGEDDPKWVYLLEKRALEVYTDLLNDRIAKNNDSLGSQHSNVIERMNDLYIELNSEKRYSFELSGKIQSLQAERNEAQFISEALQTELDSLRQKNTALTTELELEKSKVQKIREDLYTTGERANVLSRITASTKVGDTKRLEDKIYLLQQRILFLEQNSST
jgi:chromosome segregation ATPase